MMGPRRNKKIISSHCPASFAILLILTSCMNGADKTAREIHEMLLRPQEHGGVIIVDIRNQTKYRDGHIRGAINIPVESKNFEERFSQLDNQSELVIYCGTGLKTDKAAETASRAGFKKVHALQGGVKAWKEAGYALER